ncbi:U3 snoRNP protein [Scheffersomyces xylosifermentans]|uniref:U3 snoRNP protein n=1 Tax=Scheffersomyces xylosifermentans TaxID=1304137 RepID=UPI00315CB7B7
MVEPIDKRRKLDDEAKSVKTKTPRASKIFSPFRVLGNVSNETPFAIGTLGSTFYIVTSVGRSFQIYDAATLHLLFVSQSQTPSKITCLAAHSHFVFAGYSNKIGIYKRGRLEHLLEAPTSETITHILPFGEYLVATASDGDVFVFKKPSGKKIASELYTTLKGINTAIDGSIVGLIHPPTYLNKIVVATTSGLILFNIRTGKLLFRSPAQQFTETISCVEAAPVLDIIAVGTTTGGVYLYNLKKGKVLGKKIVAAPEEASAKVVSLSFRTDGSPHLVAGLSTGDLFFFDLAQQARVHILRNAHKEIHGGVASAKFLNGQPIVVTNGGDNHLKEYVFDPTLSTSNSSIVSPPRHLRSRGGHSAPPVAIEFPDEEKSHFIYSASRDKSFWAFSLRKDAQAQEMSQRIPKSKNGKRQAGPVQSMREKFPEIIAIASSQAREGDWENVLTAHKDEPFARTWDSRNKRVGRFNLNTIDNGMVKSVCISQCGNFGLVGSAQGGIGVYNLQSGTVRKRYVLHKKAVTGVAIDGMNRKMVSCGLDGIVGFYDFTQSKYLGKLQLDAPVTSMVYHKSSDLIACALDDLSIVIVDVTTQKVVRVLIGHTNRITSLDFSPDGRWIVSVSLDATLRTWDLPTGGCIDGVRLPVVATGVKFSPIGDMLATTHVSGNGISLWTNRAQFKPISTRHVEEEDFSTILLPTASGDGGSTLLDGALEEDEEDETINAQSYSTLDQIDDSLVTLSLGSRSKYSNLIHLDVIKQRNKPKEAPKKPGNTPFFLTLGGEAVGDRASVAEGKAAESSKQVSEEAEGLRNLKNGESHDFESKFTKLLRQGSEQSDYSEFLKYLIGASPAVIDLEIRSLNSFPPLNEMASFVEALNQGLRSNKDFELFQAVFSMYLKNHGDVIHNNADETALNDALEKWSELNSEREQKMDELVKYCSGVINFLSSV